MERGAEKRLWPRKQKVVALESDLGLEICRRSE